jgi:DNA-binding transcriptional LysR family regulator
MTPDQLPHLETFAQAAELSSFTAAARALGLTQAAVSQRIQALEKQLGTSLFRRRGGRVLLTDAGRRLHPFAQQILALHQEARGKVTGKKTPVPGELILAASSVPGEHLLPAALSRFQKLHPHIQVKATVGDSLAVLRLIEQGQAHLGLVGRKNDSPHLEFRSFACDELVLVVPVDHPWLKKRRVTMAQLLAQPLVLREAGSGSRWCLETALSKAGYTPRDLRIALELGSNEAIKEAVLRGLGAAVLSTHAVERELAAGKLHALKITGLELHREMYVAWDRRRVLPIPARLFLDLLDPCAGRARLPPSREPI